MRPRGGSLPWAGGFGDLGSAELMPAPERRPTLKP